MITVLFCAEWAQGSVDILHAYRIELLLLYGSYEQHIDLCYFIVLSTWNIDSKQCQQWVTGVDTLSFSILSIFSSVWTLRTSYVWRNAGVSVMVCCLHSDDSVDVLRGGGMVHTVTWVASCGQEEPESAWPAILYWAVLVCVPLCCPWLQSAAVWVYDCIHMPWLSL